MDRLDSILNPNDSILLYSILTPDDSIRFFSDSGKIGLDPQFKKIQKNKKAHTNREAGALWWSRFVEENTPAQILRIEWTGAGGCLTYSPKKETPPQVQIGPEFYWA